EAGFACANEELADDTICSDGDLCTGADVCVSGVCVGSPLQCNDHNACSDDSCDPATGSCVHAAISASCDDDNICTENDTCVDGLCAGTVVAPCCGNLVCEPGEDCSTCTDDCAGVTTGPAGARYCCGNGTAEPA